MPTYGEKKKKDICRSVLPAKRRYAATAKRQKQRISRHERRTVNQKIGQYSNRFSDLVDDLYLDEEKFDFAYSEDQLKRDAMWDRRLGDKLGALLRWAPHQVDDIRKLDRLSKMKTILPDNLPGRHALTHLEFEDDFYIKDVDYWYDRYEQRKAEREFLAAVNAAVVMERLRLVVELGLQSQFNKKIRGIIEKRVETLDRERGVVTYKTEYVDRPLLGVDDIEQFLIDCVGKLSWGPPRFKNGRVSLGPRSDERIENALKELMV